MDHPGTVAGASHQGEPLHPADRPGTAARCWAAVVDRAGCGDGAQPVRVCSEASGAVDVCRDGPCEQSVQQGGQPDHAVALGDAGAGALPLARAGSIRAVGIQRREPRAVRSAGPRAEMDLREQAGGGGRPLRQPSSIECRELGPPGQRYRAARATARDALPAPSGCRRRGPPLCPGRGQVRACSAVQASTRSSVVRGGSGGTKPSMSCRIGWMTGCRRVCSKAS